MCFHVSTFSYNVPASSLHFSAIFLQHQTKDEALTDEDEEVQATQIVVKTKKKIIQNKKIIITFIWISRMRSIPKDITSFWFIGENSAWKEKIMVLVYNLHIRGEKLFSR